GKSLLSNGPAGLNRWDWRTGKKLRTYPATFAPIAFLKGGKAMAVVGYANSLWVLDVETGKDLCPLGRPGHRITFSPPALPVAWPEGGTVVPADAATGKEVQRWSAHEGAIGALAFAPDGETFATAGTDQRIRIWRASTGKEIHSMPYEGLCPGRLVFAADGRRLASGSGWHSDVCIWDVATGKRRNRWQGGGLTTLDPGVRVVAVADRKAGVLRLADAMTGKALHALAGYQEVVGYFYPRGAVTFCTYRDFPPLFSPDGRLVLVGGGEFGGKD